jgi:hypothetical protein
MKHLLEYTNFQKIEESLISSVDSAKLVDKDLIDHMLFQNEEFLIPSYKDENYLHDIEDEDIDRDDFLDWVEYDLKFRIDELIRFYENEVIKNGRVTVWRKITVSEDWMDHFIKEGKHLGIYWTWDPDAAETHWGDYSKKSVALIEAEVPENGVDWEKTLRINIEPFIGDDEKEITLNKGVPLKIVSVEIDGKLVDITPIQGKTFFA